MLSILEKYAVKLISHCLVTPSDICLLALDDEIYSFTSSEGQGFNESIESSLKQVFDLININSILYAMPREPYRSIIRSLLRWGTTNSKILPRDCETRTFFHDIPVIDEASPHKIAQVLSERKAAIISEGPAIVSYGSVSPEQAFVSFSSTCFSTFVKYFYDHLAYLDKCKEQKKVPESARLSTFDGIRTLLDKDYSVAHLGQGPPRDEDAIIDLLSEAGKKIVEERLVDSFFGNISFFTGRDIFISETAAALDELHSALDKIPLDGSSSVGITASSEVSTHRKIFETTKARSILHGHPRFSVVMSMYCTEECEHTDQCYRSCTADRSVCNVKIVPGEIGTGPTGIVNTVPKALQSDDAVIVYGHGVFCTGSKDFNSPLNRMIEIERCCRSEYFKRVGVLL